MLPSAVRPGPSRRSNVGGAGASDRRVGAAASSAKSSSVAHPRSFLARRSWTNDERGNVTLTCSGVFVLARLLRSPVTGSLTSRCRPMMVVPSFSNVNAVTSDGGSPARDASATAGITAGSREQRPHLPTKNIAGCRGLIARAKLGIAHEMNARQFVGGCVTGGCFARPGNKVGQRSVVPLLAVLVEHPRFGVGDDDAAAFDEGPDRPKLPSGKRNRMRENENAVVAALQLAMLDELGRDETRLKTHMLQGLRVPNHGRADDARVLIGIGNVARRPGVALRFPIEQPLGPQACRRIEDRDRIEMPLAVDEQSADPVADFAKIAASATKRAARANHPHARTGHQHPREPRRAFHAAIPARRHGPPSGRRPTCVMSTIFGLSDRTISRLPPPS